MIALDTNVLVYAHREDSQWHEAAYARVKELAEGRGPWCIPWPCIHEYLAIVTHPRIYSPPTPLTKAIDQLQAWIESPSLLLLAETSGYWLELEKLLRSSRATGPQVHDARIVAICRVHGVRELWSADRDFSRFAGVNIRNPLIG